MDIEILKDELLKIKEDFSKLSENNSVADEKICTLKEANEKLKAELALTKELHGIESSEAKEQLEKRNKDIELLKEELLNLKEDNGQHELETRRLEAHFEKEKHELEQQLTSKNEEIKDIREEMKIIQNVTLSSKKENEGKIEILEIEIEKYQDVISLEKAKAESYLEKVQFLEECYNKLQVEKNVLTDRLEEKAQRAKNINNLNEELRADLKKQVEFNKSAENSMDRMMMTIRTQEHELKSLRNLNQSKYDVDDIQVITMEDDIEQVPASASSDIIKNGTIKNVDYAESNNYGDNTDLVQNKRVEELMNIAEGEDCIKIFTCKVCKKQLSSRTSLRTHIESIHFVSKAVLCKLCLKEFRNKASLKTHIGKKHKDKILNHNTDNTPKN